MWVHGDERLGARVRGDAVLLAVAGHVLAVDDAPAVLAAHDVLGVGADRLQHLDLLVAHGVGVEVDRRLHRDQARSCSMWFWTMSRMAPAFS